MRREGFGGRNEEDDCALGGFDGLTDDDDDFAGFDGLRDCCCCSQDATKSLKALIVSTIPNIMFLLI